MLYDWKTVQLFISSTFIDMHAERDYLIKHVFPELTQWCEERKIRLFDVDLRWGVTTEEKESNHALRKCLENIDDCRPFFLCLLGQRRGTVLNDRTRLEYEMRHSLTSEISEETKTEYPGVEKHDGKRTMTEMEVEHADLEPMERIVDGVRSAPTQESSAVYFERDAGWLSEAQGFTEGFTELHRRAYTNAEVLKWGGNPAEAEAEMQAFRARIRAKGREIVPYFCRWSFSAESPELSEEKWGEEKVGDVLRKGRLMDFVAGDKRISFKEALMAQIQQAILSSEEFKERIEPCVVSTDKYVLDKEQQEIFVQIASEGYVPRSEFETSLAQYINDSGETRPFLLRAKAGLGKTTLLAHFVHSADSTFDKAHGIYRFCGASDLTTDPLTLWNSICKETKVFAPETLDGLRQRMPEILREMAEVGIRHIVIDAVNQMQHGEEMLEYLPDHLPPGLKLVLSVAETEADRQKIDRFHGCELKELDDETIIQRLIDLFLCRHMKSLDEERKNEFCALKPINPLFLKVVLHELHFFGVHEKLKEKIEAYKNDPLDAFDKMLHRLETDIGYQVIVKAVPFLFGLLSHARYGLTEKEMLACFRQQFPEEDDESLLGTIRFYLRQVRPFMARRNGRVDFLYRQFQEAAAARYRAELHFVLAQALYDTRPGECAYHARKAENGDYLRQIYTNLDFLNRFYRNDGAYKLNEEAQKVASGIIPEDILSFIDETKTVLEQHPDAAAATFYKELPVEYKAQAQSLCQPPWIKMNRCHIRLSFEKTQSVKAASIQKQDRRCGCIADNTQEAFLLVSLNTVQVIHITSLQKISSFRVEEEAENPIARLYSDLSGKYLVAVRRDGFCIYKLRRGKDGGIISCDRQMGRTCRRLRFYGAMVFVAGNTLIYQLPEGTLSSLQLDDSLQERQILSTEHTLLGYFSAGQLYSYYLFKTPTGLQLCSTTDSKAQCELSAKINKLLLWDGKLVVLPDDRFLLLCNPETLQVQRRLTVDFVPKSAVPMGEEWLLTDEHGALYTGRPGAGFQGHGMLAADYWDKNPCLFSLGGERAFFMSDSRYAILQKTSAPRQTIIQAKAVDENAELLVVDKNKGFLVQTMHSQKELTNIFKDSTYGIAAMKNYKCDWNADGEILSMGDGQTAELFLAKGKQVSIPAADALDLIVDIRWLKKADMFVILYRSGQISMVSKNGHTTQTEAYPSATGNYLLCDCGNYFCVVSKRRQVRQQNVSIFEETAVSIFDSKGRRVHEEHLRGVDHRVPKHLAYDRATHKVCLIGETEVIQIQLDGGFPSQSMSLFPLDTALDVVAVDDGILYVVEQGLCAVDLTTGRRCKTMPLHRSVSSMHALHDLLVVVENNERVYTVHLER